MVKMSSAKLVVAAGVLALSFTTGIAVASADPDLSPLINSTCSYGQVVQALNDQPGGAAQAFNVYTQASRSPASLALRTKPS